MRTEQEFKYFSLEDAHLARGAVVVIDVLRAFTTAAYALDGGALRIFPVGTVTEAFALKKTLHQAVIMGEEQGYKPEGFDLGNSPAEIRKADLSGKNIIQRTSAGTQGIINVAHAQVQVAASFVVAAATAAFLRKANADRISFIITGESQGRDGDEDRACGQYIQALLQGGHPEPDPFVSCVLSSSVGQSFLSGKLGYLSQEDLRLSIDVNRFNFCLPVTQRLGRRMIQKLDV